MPATLNSIAFIVLAFGMILGALASMTSRNVLHAAFWLLELAISAAGFFYFLNADYIALMQLMVYAGAVGVLIVFTIMITLRSREDAMRPRDFSIFALIVAVAFFGFMAYAILNSPSMAVDLSTATLPSIADFGEQLFAIDGYALPFEIASLVLTVALIAAVWWTRDGDDI